MSRKILMVILVVVALALLTSGGTTAATRGCTVELRTMGPLESQISVPVMWQGEMYQTSETAPTYFYMTYDATYEYTLNVSEGGGDWTRLGLFCPNAAASYQPLHVHIN